MAGLLHTLLQDCASPVEIRLGRIMMCVVEWNKSMPWCPDMWHHMLSDWCTHHSMVYTTSQEKTDTSTTLLWKLKILHHNLCLVVI